MSDRTRRLTLTLIAALTGLDIVATAVMRVMTSKMPVALGDVSKVGIGALAGAAVMGKVSDRRTGDVT